MNKITIFYLSIGSGHKIAAEALAEAFKRYAYSIGVEAVDPFSRKIDLLPSIFDSLQAASVTLTPGIYDRLWRQGGEGIINMIKDIGVLQSIMMDYFQDTISNIVISTHVLPCAIASTLKRSGIVKSVYAVITDFGVNSLWPRFEIDGYFVGNQELLNILQYRNYPCSNILVTGIPIKLDFEKAGSTGVVTDDFKILLVIGGIRGGAYTTVRDYVGEILEGIKNLTVNNLKVSIVLGNQDYLKTELEKFAKDLPYNVQLYGYVQDMRTLFYNHDVVITKPGGLIVSELLACGSCIILLKPGPGQENANAEFLARHKAAFRGETPDEITSVLKKCIDDPNTVIQMRERTKLLGKPNSSQYIVKKILSLENLDVF